MAPSLLPKVLLLSVFLAVAGARQVPNKSAKKTDVKHPEFLVTVEPQPTVLIPGMGRYLLPPKCKKPLYPYNPVTGAPLDGGDIPSAGAQGATPRTQIPGGDDTLVPPPADSVPTPATAVGNPTGGQVPPLPHP